MSEFKFGIVEDINDPLSHGRVRVRVHGIHSLSKVDLPTEDLPWASILHSTSSAGKKGIGFGGCGLIVGSDVMVVFRDPGHFQQPIVIGTLPGLYEGEDGSSIKAAKDGTARESDLGRLATGNLTDKTIIKTKNDSVTKVKSDSVSIEEPTSKYAAKYGNNFTYTTPGGHVIELDDTSGAERIHVYHKSGTFTEIHPDGSNVVRTVGDTYSINKKTLNVIVGSNHISSIGGDETTEVGGSVLIVVSGNTVVQTKGDTTLETSGKMLFKSGGDMTFQSGGNINSTASGDQVIKGSTINLN